MNYNNLQTTDLHSTQINIQNDPKTITTQRIIKIKDNVLEYELNMSTYQNERFEDHLSAKLNKTFD